MTSSHYYVQTATNFWVWKWDWFLFLNYVRLQWLGTIILKTLLKKSYKRFIWILAPKIYIRIYIPEISNVLKVIVIWIFAPKMANNTWIFVILARKFKHIKERKILALNYRIELKLGNKNKKKNRILAWKLKQDVFVLVC